MAEKRVTPLWIIALFVSLTEAVLGVAVTVTDGGIQAALTGFVIGFPLLVAGAFFFILWNKPYVFYTPKDFGPEIPVTKFVAAMKGRSLDEHTLYSQITEVIQGTFKELFAEVEAVVSKTSNRAAEQQIGHLLNRAANETVERIRKVGFLTIDSRPLLGNRGRVWQVPYQDYKTVSELLDDIWYSIRVLPPYSFGEKWILRDPASGRLFKEMGTVWTVKQELSRLPPEERYLIAPAYPHTVPSWLFAQYADNRSLEDVGIHPGMTLEVISPQMETTEES